MPFNEVGMVPDVIMNPHGVGHFLIPRNIIGVMCVWSLGFKSPNHKINLFEKIANSSKEKVG